jgi:hypothetical protein
LEKADRFSKDKQPAESGAYPQPLPLNHSLIMGIPAPTHKPSSSIAHPTKPAPNQSATERYNLLQKKVDELEKVHLEGKKAVRYHPLILKGNVKLFITAPSRARKMQTRPCRISKIRYRTSRSLREAEETERNPRSSFAGTEESQHIRAGRTEGD